MTFAGYFFLAFMALTLWAVVWAWWHKFVTNQPERYGKGPGHDLRGPERGQWDRPDKIN